MPRKNPLPSTLLWIRRAGALLALVDLVLQFSGLSDRDWHELDVGVDLSLIVLLLLDRVGSLAPPLYPERPPLLGWVRIGLLLVYTVLAFGLALVRGNSMLEFLLLAAADVYFLGRAVGALVFSSEWLLSHAIRPAWLLVGSFAALIGVGTLLLYLPGSRSPTAPPWKLTDALFTTTSAACVTGLSVRDASTELSFRGQVVLLLLIQIGGLGPFTCTMFLSFLRRQRFSLRQSIALRELLSIEGLGDLGEFMSFAILATLGLELVGAVILYLACPLPLGPLERAWWSVFHSISAFCNAGFGLHTNSFVDFQSNWSVCLPLCLLVILGGLGFPVLLDLARWRPTALLWWRRRLHSRGKTVKATPARLTLHTRLVLATSGILLWAGAVVFYLFEMDRGLAQLDWATAWLVSLFHSTVARTAGFNSIDLAVLHQETLLLLVLLMIIGAAPVSTGGGVRVIAAAIVVLTIRAMVENRDRATAFRRSLPRSTVNSAVTVIAVYLLTLLAIVTLLMLTHPTLEFGAVLFESVSALSTVGLSIGVTTEVGDIGRLILCLGMFLGRLGALALLYALLIRKPAARVEYPEENVLVS